MDKRSMDKTSQHTNQSLRLSEQLLEAKECLGCMHEGMLVTAIDGTIIETTPAAERILETPSVALKGHNIEEFCYAREVYTDIRRQASQQTRSLNRSLVVSSAAGKRKLVNMS